MIIENLRYTHSFNKDFYVEELERHDRARIENATCYFEDIKAELSSLYEEIYRLAYLEKELDRLKIWDELKQDLPTPHFNKFSLRSITTMSELMDEIAEIVRQAAEFIEGEQQRDTNPNEKIWNTYLDALKQSFKILRKVTRLFVRMEEDEAEITETHEPFMIRSMGYWWEKKTKVIS